MKCSKCGEDKPVVKIGEPQDGVYLCYECLVEVELEIAEAIKILKDEQ